MHVITSGRTERANARPGLTPVMEIPMPKATHDTTPTSAAPPPTAKTRGASAPTRRALLAGTSAAILAVGSATAPAAEVSAKAPAVSPDAILLRLCRAFQRADAALATAGAAQVSDEVYAPLHAAWWRTFYAVEATPPASTDQGRIAKAQVGLAKTRDVVSNDAGSSMMFVRAVLDEVVAAGTPLNLTGGQHPDGALMVLAAEVCRLEADSIPLLRAADPVEADPGYGGAAHLAAEAALRVDQTAQNAAMTQLAAMPARSLAGLRAKGNALAAYYGGDIPEDEAPCGALLASLLDDLTGHGVAT